VTIVGPTARSRGLHDVKRAPRGGARFCVLPFGYLAAFASLLLWRAAAFLWISPFREARSSSLTAASFSSAEVPPVALLSAVRRAERWARLRIEAARDFRMFFFADAILGNLLISGR